MYWYGNILTVLKVLAMKRLNKFDTAVGLKSWGATWNISSVGLFKLFLFDVNNWK